MSIMLVRGATLFAFVTCASVVACGELRREAPDGGPAVGTVDAAAPGPPPLGSVTGGPCTSGAKGATALRVRYEPGDAGNAVPVVEAFGLADDAGFFDVSTFVGVGGHEPTFAEATLGTGGIALDQTNGVDVKMSLQNLPPIHAVTLALLARSNTPNVSSSFQWSGGHGSGKSPPGSVGATATNVWVQADATRELGAVDFHDVLRITAGPPSNTLIVQRIELCIDLAD